MGGGAAAPAVDDPADAHLAPWVRERERTAKGKVRPFLHLLYDAQREYGAGWYYQPGRWPTSDGVVPWTEFLAASKALWAFRAIDRMNTTRAIGVAFAGDTPDGQRVRAAEVAEAFPDGKQDR